MKGSTSYPHKSRRRLVKVWALSGTRVHVPDGGWWGWWWADEGRDVGTLGTGG